MNYVIKSPLREWEGAASRPADLDPSESEGESSDGREAGEGVGVGTKVAQVLKVLMVSLL